MLVGAKRSSYAVPEPEVLRSYGKGYMLFDDNMKATMVLGLIGNKGWLQQEDAEHCQQVAASLSI